jgi:hypothetical protein
LLLLSLDYFFLSSLADKPILASKSGEMKPARDHVVRSPINICSFAPRKGRESGAARHPYLIQISLWQVGTDRSVIQ